MEILTFSRLQIILDLYNHNLFNSASNEPAMEFPYEHAQDEYDKLEECVHQRKPFWHLMGSFFWVSGEMMQVISRMKIKKHSKAIYERQKRAYEKAQRRGLDIFELEKQIEIGTSMKDLEHLLGESTRVIMNLIHDMYPDSDIALKYQAQKEELSREKQRASRNKYQAERLSPYKNGNGPRNHSGRLGPGYSGEGGISRGGFEEKSRKGRQLVDE